MWSSWSGTRAAHLWLRAGLAFALLYPPYAALGDPVSWASYFPDFVRAVPVDLIVLLYAFGIIEVALALWILSGWRIRVPAALAALVLVAIVAVNLAEFEVLFRDLAIAAMALALVVWPAPNAPQRQQI